jgi:hypothetical protein
MNNLNPIILLQTGDSSVGIVMGYGLDNPGSTPGSAKFSLLSSVQTNAGAHLALYPMGTRGSFHGDKAAKAARA